MNEPQRLLSITDLTVELRGRRELDRISLLVDAGETVVVIGEAGSGQDALMRVLAKSFAEDEVFSGQIAYGTPGVRLRPTGTSPRIAYLPGPALRPLSPHAAASSQLARVIARKLGQPLSSGLAEFSQELGRHAAAPPFAAFEQRAGELAPETLAWGLLAAALAQTPDLLLVDHLFEGLAPRDARSLERAVLAAKARLNCTLVCATMTTETAAGLGGRLIILRQGRIVEEGSLERIVGQQAHSYTRMLFKEPEARKRRSARGQPVVQAFGLGLESRSGARDLLNFELRRGGALALIGEEGSGRHSLVRKILGLERLRTGRVVFDAVDVGILSPSMMARLRRHIAVLSGTDEVLDPRMTLWDTVAEPLRTHLGLPNDLVADYCELALRRVGLASLPGKASVSELSTFDRRRLQVARAIVGAPVLAILDEPFRGLDAFARSVIREVLQSFRTEEGPAFLLVTSDVSVAYALADEAMVFHDGRIVERGSLAEIVGAPKTPYSRSLVEASRLSMPALSPLASAV